MFCAHTHSSHPFGSQSLLCACTHSLITPCAHRTHCSLILVRRYFEKNKALDRFFRNAERWVWKLVLDNEYDDIKPLLAQQNVQGDTYVLVCVFVCVCVCVCVWVCVCGCVCVCATDPPALNFPLGMHNFVSALMTSMTSTKARLWAEHLQHRELSDRQFATTVVPKYGKGSPEVPLLYKMRSGAIANEEQLLEEVGVCSRAHLSIAHSLVADCQCCQERVRWSQEDIRACATTPLCVNHFRYL
jgi:hypothetical protein